MTNYTFGEVYNLPVIEFFTYVAYLRYKAAQEEKRIKALKKKK